MNVYSIWPTDDAAENFFELPDTYGESSWENSILNLNRENYTTFNLDMCDLNFRIRKPIYSCIAQTFCSEGILINAKIKEIMDGLKLPPHRFFKLNFRSGFKRLDYYLLYIDFNMLDFTIFNESEFEIENGLRELSTIQISNKNQYDNFRNKRTTHPSTTGLMQDTNGLPKIGNLNQRTKVLRNSINEIHIRKTVFKSELLETYDLFSSDYHFYGTSKLKQALTEVPNLGLEFIAAKNIIAR